MFETLSRSWQITKLSFSVIKKDKEILLFPLLSGFFSILFIFSILFPTIFVSLLAGEEFVGSIVDYILLFLVYLGLAFIATFFNVATVYTTKKRFEGGNASFMESINFAFSKIHIIFMWSLVSAIVGIFLRLLENLANRMKGGGQFLVHILRGILGVAWGIVTLFVIPVLVYKGLSPFAAIKESSLTIKKTWGESLVRHFGLGLIQFLFLLIGIVLTFLLIFFFAFLGIYFIFAVLIFGIIYVLGVILIFTVANNVYNTALYVYAQTGEIPTGFNSEVLKDAFQKQN